MLLARQLWEVSSGYRHGKDAYRQQIEDLGDGQPRDRSNSKEASEEEINKGRKLDDAAAQDRWTKPTADLAYRCDLRL